MASHHTNWPIPMPSTCSTCKSFALQKAKGGRVRIFCLLLHTSGWHVAIFCDEHDTPSLSGKFVCYIGVWVRLRYCFMILWYAQSKKRCWSTLRHPFYSECCAGQGTCTRTHPAQPAEVRELARQPQYEPKAPAGINFEYNGNG